MIRPSLIPALRVVLTTLAFAIIPAVPVFGEITVTLTLDDFSVTQEVDTETVNPATDTLANAGLLGGERIFDLWTTNMSRFNVVFTDGGDLNLSTLSGNSSITTITFDGIDANGLNGFDVTAGGGTHFLLDFRSWDGTADWTLNVTDMVGGSDSAVVGLTDTSDAVVLPFSAFSSADLTNLKTISYEVASTGATTGLDFALDVFAAATVPEPSSGLLLTATLCALSLRRRRI